LEIQFLNRDEEFLIRRDDVHYAYMIIIEGSAEIKISSGKVLTFGKNDIIYSDLLLKTIHFIKLLPIEAIASNRRYLTPDVRFIDFRFGS
jgi:hypothetical protein